MCSALSNVADEGLLTEGFFWIPSLAGPTTVNVSGARLRVSAAPAPASARAGLRLSPEAAACHCVMPASQPAPALLPHRHVQHASPASSMQGGLGWLTSWENGAPSLGWAATGAYLVLPILLIVSQVRCAVLCCAVRAALCCAALRCAALW